MRSRNFGGGVVSPENPVEIETVEITKFISCGHNLFDPSQAIAGGTINGITLTNNGDGTFDLNGTASDTAFFKLYTVSKSGTYHFYGLEINVGGSVRIDVRDDSLSNMVGSEYDMGGKIPITFVVANQPLVLTIRIEKGYTANNLSIKPMLYQEGNGEYEPFIGKSITAELSLYSLPDGTRDEYKNGKLIRKVGKVDFDGSEDEVWNAQNSTNPYFATRLQEDAKDVHQTIKPNMLCNRLELASGDQGWGGTIPYSVSLTSGIAQRNHRLRIRVKGVTTVDAFKVWLQTHPVTVYYELATPITETINIPVIPTQAPYTTIAHDSPVETEVEYEILTKSDYAADIIDIKQRLAALESAAIE